jgi:outer membrane protein assembly factor BamA
MNEFIGPQLYNNKTIKKYRSTSFTSFQVLQLSLAGGVMKSLNPNKDVNIGDRFFLGGPLTLRGFNMKGLGPHSDGKKLYHLTEVLLENS